MITLPQASGILSDLAHHEMTNDGVVQAGFSRASIARLCATTEDHTKDLKCVSPFQLQRANP